MPSPFPGIDPYLEAQEYWGDFHPSFTTYCRDLLNELLPDGYVAQLGEQVRLGEVPRREAKGRIHILCLPKRTPSAMIEVLSPAHKTDDGFAEYQLKRRKTIRQKIHLVEFDLLLGGQGLPMVRALPHGDYYALVARAERRPDCDVYARTIRDPLPSIPIPLLAPDPDVVLDLGAVFATAYERGRYARWLDYTAPLAIVKKPEDRAWAEQIARRRR
jgi:hypothetical protein